MDVAPQPPGPLAVLLGKARALIQRSAGDPFYAVVAYRNYRREP